jgi:orotate phosphoribosyltransferase
VKTQHIRHLEATGSQGQWVCSCRWRSSVSGGAAVDTDREWRDHLTSVYRQLEHGYAKLADLLFELGAVKFAGIAGEPAEGYKLKLHEDNPLAPRSPIYLNLRTPDNPKPGPLTADALTLIGKLLYAMLHRIDGLDFRYVADIPNAGKPIADALMANLDSWSRVQRIHLVKQESGGKRQIIGVQERELVPGARVILVDDLITQADTKLEAIKVVQDARLRAEAVMLAVDRQQGGREQVEQAGCPVYSLFTLPELMVYYLNSGKLDAETVNRVMTYLVTNSV